MPDEGAAAAPMSMPVGRRTADWATLAAGAALPLAFAPFGWWPVAFLSLAVLFALLPDGAPRRALWRGWLYGFGCFGTGVSWVFLSIHQYGHAPWLLAAVLILLFVAALALFPAVLGWSAARLALPPAPRLLLWLPAGWVFLEWVRSWLLTGFPWLSLGHSQAAGPLGALAPVAGVLGVSWAAALTAGALSWAAVAGRRGLWSLLLLVPAWGAIVWLDRVEWTRPAGGPLEVALVQGNVPQEVKWLPSRRPVTLRLYRELTRAHRDADVIVWPESAIPAFYHQAEDYLAQVEDDLATGRATLLTGILYYDVQTGRYYNSLLGLGPPRRLYHKRHLVPFGEFLPLAGPWRKAINILQVPLADFTPGPEDQPLLQAAGYPVGGSICYEIAFGEEIRKALPEAAFLVNVSNDGWFGDSLAPHQHLEIARFRARETGRWVLRATNTGISALIDHRGRLAASIPQFQAGVLRGTITPRAGATPYVRFGETPVVAASLLALSAALVGIRRRRRGGPGVRE